MTKPTDREKAYARCTRELERLIEDAGDLSLDEMTVQALRTAIEAMAAVAAAPEGAQPVAWACTDYDGHVGVGLTKEEAKRQAGESCNEYFPLYTTPPQPQDAVRDREDVRS